MNCRINLNQLRAGRFIFVLLTLLITVSSPICIAWGSNEKPLVQLSGLITNGGYLVKSTKKTISYRKNDIFLPASTLKILTSLAAFDLLGPQFKFETHFFLDKEQNLYIKGYGDPFLTSEEILRICSSLKKKGLNKIQTIFLDSSSFALQHQTPGNSNSSNPYDAHNGALAVNFNTLAINKLSDGTIQSAESQTPTLPIMKQLGNHLPSGSQRININMATVHNNMSISLQYVGELFCAQLQQTGITVMNGFKAKHVPLSLQSFLIHKNSKTLKEVIRECLHYSNNFIANQVFLYCGLQKYGSPATWDSARKFMENYLKNSLQLSSEQVSAQDGSGLSRQNRISAEALVTILEKFRPYSSLLNQQFGTLIKSGTLQGVYCYGGYFTEDESLIPFAVLLNQNNNTRDVLLNRLRGVYTSPQ